MEGYPSCGWGSRKFPSGIGVKRAENERDACGQAVVGLESGWRIVEILCGEPSRVC